MRSNERMYKGLRRLISSCLCIAMVLSLMLTGVVVVSAESKKDIVYDFENGTTMGFFKAWGGAFTDAGLENSKGILKLNLKYTGGGWEEANVAVWPKGTENSVFDFTGYESVEYEVYVPSECATSGVLKLETAFNNPWGEFSPWGDYTADNLKDEVTIDGKKCYKIKKSDVIQGLEDLNRGQLVIRFGASGKTYEGPIYLDNVKLIAVVADDSDEPVVEDAKIPTMNNHLVTRGQFIDQLVHELGLTEESTVKFSDVPEYNSYAKSISIAVKAGIIKGYSDGTFKPDNNLTREQMAVIATNAVNTKMVASSVRQTDNKKKNVQPSLESFEDRDSVSSWAKGAVSSVIRLGMMKGKTPTTFAPQELANDGDSSLVINRLAYYIKPNSKFVNFITRSGNKLMDGNNELKFISFDMPELGMQEGPFWGVIDPFEQEDAIKTIAQFGGKVTRSYVFSITGEGKTPNHVEAPGKYNEEAFEAYDNLLYLCNKYGVRLVVPFIDTWSHWGGIKEFAALRGKTGAEFYTDPQLKEDYKNLVNYVLNRTNTITGIKYKDDPAVLCWETGNELLGATDEWTKEMAAYIKSIDSKHLVMDGKYTNISQQSVEDPNIDIISNHYYGADFAARYKADVATVNNKKPFIVGEFGLQENNEVEGLINAVVNGGTSGAMIWSLRQHEADGGFRWHQESGTKFCAYHWPGFDAGDTYYEKHIVNFLREKAYEINGEKAPQIVAPDSAPVLLPINNVTDIRWRGVVGASGYDIERAENPEGSWAVVGKNVSDSVNDPEKIVTREVTDRYGNVISGAQERILFQDTTAEKGKTYYYRVKGLNSGGATGYSNIQKVTSAGFTSGLITDTNLSKAYDKKENQYVIYKTEGSINSFLVNASFDSSSDVSDFKFYTSVGGGKFKEAKVEKTNMGGDSQKLQFTSNKLSRGVKYLKIQYPNASAKIALVKVGFGEMKVNIPVQEVAQEISVLDDYEGYGSDNAKLRNSYALNQGGGTVNLTLDQTNKTGGNYGLKYDYDLGEPGYAGLTKKFGGNTSWTGKESLKFWFKPDGSGNKLVIQFKEDNGEYWEVGKVIDSTEPKLMKIPFSEFAQPGWGGKVDGILDLTKVSEFSIYVNKVDTTKTTKGTLYFDDFTLAFSNIIEDAESFSGDNAKLVAEYTVSSGGGDIKLSLDKQNKNDGEYSIKYEYNTGTPTYAGVTNKFAAPAYWAGAKGIQFWFKPDGSNNKLVIQFKESNGEYWEVGNVINFTDAKLMTIPFTNFAQPGWGGKVDGKLDLSKISEISIYVNKIDGSKAEKGVLYFDSMKLME